MRRERLLFAALAVVLVLLRSFVPTFYEGFFFDSDQAIVGLMARRLSTFQDFPLYYYGLNYLLGVQAWIIAPFFWLFRSSLAVMRLPLIALNVVVGVWLVGALGSRLKLSPAVAFVASLPFLIPTPAVSAHLLETAGASIEPFVYVLLLWRLRRRPFAFGLLLALGFLHREFTIFVVPALVLVEAAGGDLWTRATVRRGAWMAAGFALVWLIVDDLKMHLTGQAAALQLSSLRNQMCFDDEWMRRVAALLRHALPALYGGLPADLQAFRINSSFNAGHWPIAWLAGAAIALMLARLALRWRRDGDTDAETGLGAYLVWVGVFTACAYPLSCNVAFGTPPLLRYLLLALLLPVGAAAAFLRREQSRPLRLLVMSAFVAWAAVNLFDHVRLIAASAADPPSNERRVLTDYLLAHRIGYARAIYWDAYVVDFLSRERVVTASVDVVRIPSYQKEVDAHHGSAVNLARLPCSGGERVASWCVQKE